VPKSTNRPGCAGSLWMTCSTVSGRASPKRWHQTFSGHAGEVIGGRGCSFGVAWRML
jgi:hypothetical protein